MSAYARLEFSWRVTQAHFAAAVRFASVSACVIPAFFRLALRFADSSALAIAVFLPAALRFLFVGCCFLVAALFARPFAIPVLRLFFANPEVCAL
ncbi:MAG TPA: hypothetical protein VH933_17465 [Aestuariivirgaceae bacterium]